MASDSDLMKMYGGVDEPQAPISMPDLSHEDLVNRYAGAGTTAEKPKFDYFKDTISGRILKTIGKAVTLPGDVAQGKVSMVGEDGHTNPEVIGRAADLAGVAGTGAIPSVTRQGASSIFGGGISPEVAQIAKTAIDKYGFPVRPGQLSENHFVRSLDSLLQKIPGSGYAKNAAEQQSAIDSGLAKIIGVDADKLTPSVMSEARSKMQKSYKEIYGPDVKAKIDDKFSAGIMDTLDRAKDVLDTPDKVKVLNKAVSNILDKVTGAGEISGPAYQGLRQTKSQLKDLQNSGGQLGQYAGEIKGHLDDLFRRTIPPDKADLLRKTDQQYAIMKQLRPVVNETGTVPPARLMQIARSTDAGKERMAFGNGGDLGELANIGQRFKTMPSSNTAENSTLLHLLTGGGIGVSGVGGFMHDPLMVAGPLAAMGTGWATSRLLGSHMRNPARAQKLIQDALERKPVGVGNEGRNVGIAPYAPAIEGLSSQ